MRATLHDQAPNTYYGQWPGEKTLFPGLESLAIAHNERAASVRFVTFDVPERDFPMNRSPACWKFVCRPKRKISAPGDAARFQRRSPLLSKKRQPASGAAAYPQEKGQRPSSAHSASEALICFLNSARSAPASWARRAAGQVVGSTGRPLIWIS